MKGGGPRAKSLGIFWEKQIGITTVLGDKGMKVLWTNICYMLLSTYDVLLYLVKEKKTSTEAASLPLA